VEAGRTLLLGEVTTETLILIKQVFPAAFIFPMGATAKPLEPDKARPTDDHTLTGLNGLPHSYSFHTTFFRHTYPVHISAH